MAGGRIHNVAIRGIACAVPDIVRTLEDEEREFGREHMEAWVKRFQVRTRYLARPGVCASDLGYFAAEKLLNQLGWERDSVDLLLFASCTPDYVTPATSCILQDRLGLSKSCGTFDISHACSGTTYGLWLVANLLTGGNLKRALLIVGDTIRRMGKPNDRAGPLTGEGAAVTALEWDEQAPPMAFEVGSDGSGASFLLKKAGSCRFPSTEQTRTRSLQEDGTVRCDEDLWMNGPEIFAFALREVPPLAATVLNHAGWALDDLDGVIMHQANLYMIRTVAKKIGIPPEKQIEFVEDYGNMGGASITFAMAEGLDGRLASDSMRLMLLGFGTGLSWAGATVTCGPLVIPELSIVGKNPASGEPCLVEEATPFATWVPQD